MHLRNPDVKTVPGPTLTCLRFSPQHPPCVTVLQPGGPQGDAGTCQGSPCGRLELLSLRWCCGRNCCQPAATLQSRTCQTQSMACPCRVVVLKGSQGAKTVTLNEYVRGMPAEQPGVLFQVVVGNAPQNATKKLLERGWQVRNAQTAESCCMGSFEGQALAGFWVAHLSP